MYKLILMITTLFVAGVAANSLSSINVGAPIDTSASVAPDSVVIHPASRNVAGVAAPDSVTVGDSIGFSVSVTVPKNTRVIPPETDKGFGDFTVMSSRDITRPGKNDGQDTVIYSYHLTTFTPEDGTIPQLRFFTKAEGDTLLDTLFTAPIPIRVISLIPKDAHDSALAIRDLKAQQRAGESGLGSLWLLPLVALAIIAYYILEKRAKGYVTSTIPVVPLKPPYEEALELLAELEAKNLPERGETREYVFELSEIFKRYIGRRFDTIAPELTTEEIVAWLEFSELGRETRMCAERFFKESDQVKYAKQVPDLNAVADFTGAVKTFLEATKPDTEPPSETKTQTTEVAKT